MLWSGFGREQLGSEPVGAKKGAAGVVIWVNPALIVPAVDGRAEG